MTVLRRGMVIDVNLDPVQGSETGKIRPCIIVTNDVYNAEFKAAEVAFRQVRDPKERLERLLELHT